MALIKLTTKKVGHKIDAFCNFIMKIFFAIKKMNLWLINTKTNKI